MIPDLGPLNPLINKSDRKLEQIGKGVSPKNMQAQQALGALQGLGGPQHRAAVPEGSAAGDLPRQRQPAGHLDLGGRGDRGNRRPGRDLAGPRGEAAACLRRLRGAPRARARPRVVGERVLPEMRGGRPRRPIVAIVVWFVSVPLRRTKEAGGRRDAPDRGPASRGARGAQGGQVPRDQGRRARPRAGQALAGGLEPAGRGAAARRRPDPQRARRGQGRSGRHVAPNARRAGLHCASDGSRARRIPGDHLDRPDLPHPSPLGEGRGALRRVRDRAVGQLVRRRIAGRAQPRPLDGRLRDPVRPQHHRPAQDLTPVARRAGAVPPRLYIGRWQGNSPGMARIAPIGRRGTWIRHAAIAAAVACAAGIGAAGAGASAGSRTVEYRGYEVDVPASWPVHRLAADPSTCVRFDRHAVYLGHPGCGPELPRPRRRPQRRGARRAAAASHVRAGAARGAARPAGGRPRTAPGRRSATELRVDVPSAGVQVTATWRRSAATVRRILDGGG